MTNGSPRPAVLIAVFLLSLAALTSYALARPVGMEFRGLIWRTIDRYYHPGIYAEMYDPESNHCLLNKAKEVGANFLLVRAFYSCSQSGELVGNDAEAEDYLGRAIDQAHAEGFGIFLTPYVESACFWPDQECVLSEEVWTEVKSMKSSSSRPGSR